MPDNSNWHYRKVLDHKCNPPISARDSMGYVVNGDIWRCYCGKFHVATVNPDQRDGDYLTWAEFPPDALIPPRNTPVNPNADRPRTLP